MSFLLLLACSWSIANGRAATGEVNQSLQCVVVLTEDWASTGGLMFLFERDRTTHDWKEGKPRVPVLVGKKGLGLGRGVVSSNLRGAPIKKEGDERAPAGIFRLSTAFGYAPAHSASWVKLPYLALTKQIEGIDDPRSHYYNKLVDRSKVAKIDWRSSEQMLRQDVRYKWGVVVDHNPSATPGAGSCIFLHVWMSSSTPTTGCTAMREKDLLRLIRWLDPARRPILVQMPRAAYRSIQAKYGLPPDRS